MKRIAYFVIFMLFPVSILFAATFAVTPAGPLTIQAAIDLAASGDTILLASGTYSGPGNRDLIVPWKNLLIMSAGGNPDFCVIDCSGGAGSGITLQGSSSLVGLTIIRASAGGIFANTGNVKIQNCVVNHNTTTGWGGGIFFNSTTNGLIEDCLIFENSAANGGGVALISSSPQILRCVIKDNTASGSGGGLYLEHSSPSYIVFCLIVQNKASQGGGAYGYFSFPSFFFCTVAYNDQDGFCELSGSAWSMDHTIIAFNTGYGFHLGDQTNYSIVFTDIYGNTSGDWVGRIGGGPGLTNLWANPFFCLILGGDFHLCDNSPCAPGNHGDSQQIGSYGVGCSCQPIGVEKSTWGGIKNLYH